MVTNIIFKASSGAIHGNLSSGIVQLDYSSSQLQTSTGQAGYTIALSSAVLNKVPSASQISVAEGVYTINDIKPFQWNGQFDIYGSACTSVIQHTDTSDHLALASNSHDIAIFDGCYPCPVCQELAWIQNQIQNNQIWLRGMKDVNLLYEPEAARRWSDSYTAKISNLNPVQCYIRPTSIAMDRGVIFGKAIKLLYQYKQAVAMWNFLVRTKSAHVQIISAPQDFSGFIVQTKMNTDTCGTQQIGSRHITLTIDAILQSGQCDAVDQYSWPYGGYLRQNNLGMGIYAGRTQQNTYIEYGKDTGIHSKQNQQEGIQVSQVGVTKQEGGQIKVHSKFTFTPEKPAKTIFAGSFKVLPTIYRRGHTYQSYDQQGETITYTSPSDSISDFTLKKWIKQRSYATDISEQEQDRVNLWHICVQWSSSTGLIEPMQQNLYYSAAFGKYPVPVQSDSLSPSEIGG